MVTGQVRVRCGRRPASVGEGIAVEHFLFWKKKSMGPTEQPRHPDSVTCLNLSDIWDTCINLGGAGHASNVGDTCLN